MVRSGLSLPCLVNLVPRALFPGFRGGAPPLKPGKSALGTRLVSGTPKYFTLFLRSLAKYFSTLVYPGGHELYSPYVSDLICSLTVCISQVQYNSLCLFQVLAL